MPMIAVILKDFRRIKFLSSWKIYVYVKKLGKNKLLIVEKVLSYM